MEFDMSITWNPLSTELLGTLSVPRHSVLESLPPWVEAAMLGLVLGAYVGLWCAILLRRRVSRMSARVRVRATKRHDGGSAKSSPHLSLAQNIHQVQRQLDCLAAATQPHESDAWRAAIRQYGSDLERWRGQVE
jgi:hypothetical protein